MTLRRNMLFPIDSFFITLFSLFLGEIAVLFHLFNYRFPKARFKLSIRFFAFSKLI